MSRGNEQIGFFFVQFLDEESRRVLRQLDGFRFLFSFLAKPCPLRSSQNHFPFSHRSKAISVHAREFLWSKISWSARWQEHFPHHDPRVFPKTNPHKDRRQLPGKNMNGPDEVLGGFMRGRDKAGIAWKSPSQIRSAP